MLAGKGTTLIVLASPKQRLFVLAGKNTQLYVCAGRKTRIWLIGWLAMNIAPLSGWENNRDAPGIWEQMLFCQEFQKSILV